MCYTHAAPGCVFHRYDVIFTTVFKQIISIVKTYITAATHTLDFGIIYKQSRQLHITHNIRYYAKLLFLRNTNRITQYICNLLGRLKQSALPFQCLAAGAAALARDPVLGWLWDFQLFSKRIVHHRYESFLRFFAPLGLIW